MAVKKSELYSSLWKSCDELRGGMDASQYKDYVLVLLFIKYISDKAKAGKTLLSVPAGGSFDDLLALRNKTNIGDETNKVIGRLATANDLQGVIDLADFNDPDKLGRGKDMVDRLTNLFDIFDKPELDFGANAAEGDDLLGDAYEYLMRHFATESGKAKGQFYTPAEVSRVMAKVVGVGQATSTDQTIYDPTSGSGSLLLRAHAEALEATGMDLAIYGQEMDNATAALAKMNMILHGVESAVIWQDNTLSAPHFKNAFGGLETFDFLVANPPFSTKSWANGVNVAKDPYGRFVYGAPPRKNGDYAFLLHMLASLKSTGKAAVILPHGVLFRGNAEGNIRRELVKRGFISGIISLPPNLFYGTGIPAAIIVLDKESANSRTGIFMVDASKGFTKDGNKNRLRERDIHRIIDTFTSRDEVAGYSRMVPISEIGEPSNDYNLNIARYVPSADAVDVQDLGAHLRGGIPFADINALDKYWALVPDLRQSLFEASPNEGYLQLNVPRNRVSALVESNAGVLAFRQQAHHVTQRWVAHAQPLLSDLSDDSAPKRLIAILSESILDSLRKVPLLDGYAVYEALMTYWQQELADDVYLVCELGWAGAAKPQPADASSGDPDYTEPTTLVGKNGKQRRGTLKMASPVLPAAVLVTRYFEDERLAIESAIGEADFAGAKVEELLDEHGGDEGFLEADGGRLTKADANRLAREAKQDPDRLDELAVLTEYVEALDAETTARRAVKAAEAVLNEKLAAAYRHLTNDDARDLLVTVKWLGRVSADVAVEVDAVWARLVSRIVDLDRRYEVPLPALSSRTSELSARVDDHLRALGQTW